MTLKISILLLVAPLFLILNHHTYGHHSFAATYFSDQKLTIEGTIKEFLYRNPHSFIKVDARDEKGEMQSWVVEWGGGAQLSQDHVTRDTLRPGDKVVITGNPGRIASEHRLRMNMLVRQSDGWKWQGLVQ